MKASHLTAIALAAALLVTVPTQAMNFSFGSLCERILIPIDADPITSRIQIGTTQILISRSGKNDQILDYPPKRRGQAQEIREIYRGTLERIPVYAKKWLKVSAKLPARITAYPVNEEIFMGQDTDVSVVFGINMGTLLVNYMRGWYPEAGIFVSSHTLISTFIIPKKYPLVSYSSIKWIIRSWWEPVHGVQLPRKDNKSDLVLLYIQEDIHPRIQTTDDLRLALPDLQLMEPEQPYQSAFYAWNRKRYKGETWLLKLPKPLVWDNEKSGGQPYSLKDDITKFHGKVVSIGQENFTGFSGFTIEQNTLILQPSICNDVINLSNPSWLGDLHVEIPK